MAFRPGPDVRWRVVDDGMVIFVPSERKFIDLDHNGAVVLQLLEESGWNWDEATRRLARQHELPQADAEEIMLGFRQSLSAHGALVDLPTR